MSFKKRVKSNKKARLPQIRAANFIHLCSKIVTLGSNFVIFLGSKNYFFWAAKLFFGAARLFIWAANFNGKGSKFYYQKQQILQGLAAIFVEMSGKYI
jgi:hypothetical protein